MEMRIVQRLAPQIISTETGIPLATVRKWLKRHPLNDQEKRAYWDEANKRKSPRSRMDEAQARENRLAFSRKWYQNNKEQQAQIVTKRKRELSEWLLSIKMASHCCKCTEDHPACLEFHHRNPKDKELEISTMVARGMSKFRIGREITKCEIICSNCHRKLHWDEKHGPVVQSDRTAVS